MNARDTAQAVRRFLKDGSSDRIDRTVLAEACSRAIRSTAQKSIPSATRTAQNFVRQARKHGGILLNYALRTQGWCYHIGGRYRQAEKAYLEARSLVKRDPVWRGKVDRILIDVYMYLGDYSEALRRARSSIRAFERAGLPDEVAKTRVNLANLFHRQDRHSEASREYELAAHYFERSDDLLTLAICRYNYANTLVQLFELDVAARLYSEAERTFTELGYDLYANESRYGQSWLQLLRGEYYSALTGLASCERSYRSTGQHRGVLLCTLDRAEAYLGLNLFTDAHNAAQRAERLARKLKLQYEAAKAALFLAKAAFPVGERVRARRAIKRAEERFRQEENHAFTGVVLLTKAMANLDAGDAADAIESARSEFTSAQLPLWQAICDLQLARISPDSGAVRKRLNSNRAVRAVPHLYSQWQTLLGDRLAKKGRLAAAEKHWLRGARMLDAVRAKLPPMELRTAFLRHRSDPYLRLIKVFSKDRPDRAAAWSERYKTVGVWAPLDDDLSANIKRRRAESSMAELASRITALSTHLSDTSGSRGRLRAPTHRAWQNLIDGVRHDLAAADSVADAEPSSAEALVADFRKVGRQLPVVQFHCEESDLLAFVHRHGEVRCVRFRNGQHRLRQFLGLWHILLGRALLSGERASRSDIEDEKALFRRIGDWLWRPLEIEGRLKKVLVLPEGRLTNLPWSAVIANGQPLGDHHTLILSPSLRHYLHSRNVRVASKRIGVFVGRMDGLDHIHRELGALSTHAGADVELHDPCRRADWPHGQAAKLWHYTGHAELRMDNPFFSSLRLHDGPLFAADFRLKRNRVGLVTLAACRTGQQTYLPGEEATGLVRSLLEMGARSVIASHWAVADRSTAGWMKEFYDAYLNGLPLGESMRRAMISVREKYPSAYHWAAFSLYGAM